MYALCHIGRGDFAGWSLFAASQRLVLQPSQPVTTSVRTGLFHSRCVVFHTLGPMFVWLSARAEH
ncbi:protein of unknown function [Micropruina glycogenica]|uniref:Uncharacterized protein n=1 Tax=Micropruina glycogenica TaxID=75385 RepID=A0A2N9JL59_9ACTN|nr:protein of unknown function [Micropruina glycogenica]